MKKSYKNNITKTSAPIWNGFELSDGSYSTSDIQDYFEYILKKHWEKIVNPSKRIYRNKTENRIMFKSKTGYYLELLIPEKMKLLESTKGKLTKDKNGENGPYLEITDAVLIHCNTVNNSYQQNSRALYTFVLNKSFFQLLDISPKNFMFLKKFIS